MTRFRNGSAPLLVAATLAVAACDRGPPARGADSAQTTGSTVQPAPATPSASTPMPVSPSGSTNASTAAQGSDLSNSTRATGTSNVYQPPSSDNPAPGAAAASATAGGTSADAVAGSASASRQTTSSQTRGTSVPPNDGTLPGGTTGSTGSRRGGGKS